MIINNIPLVSVIVTTYNRKKLLKETIDSILHQTHKNFELIVVDNYSDYDVKSHIKSFNDDRIRFFQNANNGIIAVNRNIGINESKGDFIAFCDDDDIWYPKKLRKQIKCFSSKTLLVCSNAIKITFKKRASLVGLFKDSVLNFDMIMKKNYIITSSVMIRNECKNMIGLMSEEENLVAVEDYDYWLKLLKYRDNSVFFISEPLLDHLDHESNIGMSKSLKDTLKKNDKILTVLRKYDYLGNEQINKKYNELLLINNSLDTVMKYILGKKLFSEFILNRKIKISSKVKWIITKYIYSKKKLMEIIGQ